MTSTNVPQATFSEEGFVSPSIDDLYSGCFSDMNAAFGGNLGRNTDKSTPQGQLCMSLASIIAAQNDYLAYLSNQFDPAYASGRFQLGLARATGILPRGATPTVVVATCSGLTGFTIPEGSLAIATDGTIYFALSSATIPSGGSVDISFQAMTYGATPCPAGSLSRIYRTTSGWDSITNKTAGAIGSNAESRESFEARRIQSTTINARSVTASIRASLLSVSGVIDAYVYDNTDTHSLYVCVEGGSDDDVAKAIFLKKPPGAAYSGETSVTVHDDNAGYNTPPSYQVKFTRAKNPSVDIQVTLEASDNVPKNANLLISSAVQSQFQKEAKIGQEMLASVFYCPVASIGSWVRIKSILLNGNATYNVPIDSYPVVGNVDVQVS